MTCIAATEGRAPVRLSRSSRSSSPRSARCRRSPNRVSGETDSHSSKPGLQITALALVCYPRFLHDG
ncbi:hypothetical protein Ga0080574_TMP822 [Salipiger abyssi]|uniref:Uncharacterized protein n=1 Tax=Salipiger abyssi TaxID=1250539 RepID=A0A1P8UP41_9RHOB|nr:hypothetical protein Ga0080574_TMP822 [Salipiger abyssi]